MHIEDIKTLDDAIANMGNTVEHVIGWMQNDDYGDPLQDMLRIAMDILATFHKDYK